MFQSSMQIIPLYVLVLTSTESDVASSTMDSTLEAHFMPEEELDLFMSANAWASWIKASLGALQVVQNTTTNAEAENRVILFILLFLF